MVECAIIPESSLRRNFLLDLRWTDLAIAEDVATESVVSSVRSRIFGHELKSPSGSMHRYSGSLDSEAAK